MKGMNGGYYKVLSKSTVEGIGCVDRFCCSICVPGGGCAEPWVGVKASSVTKPKFYFYSIHSSEESVEFSCLTLL